MINTVNIEKKKKNKEMRYNNDVFNHCISMFYSGVFNVYTFFFSSQLITVFNVFTVNIEINH